MLLRLFNDFGVLESAEQLICDSRCGFKAKVNIALEADSDGPESDDCS